MYILNLSNPLVLLAGLLIYIVLITLGKEFKKSALPAASLTVFLLALLVYGIQLAFVGTEIERQLIMRCVGYDAILIFLSYISYLWIDDLEAKERNLKSIDNSLDWFWNKV